MAEFTEPPAPPAAPPTSPAGPSPAEIALEQRAALVRIVRMAFVVMMMTVTILYILNIGDSQRQGSSGDSALGLGLVIGWHIPLTAGLVLSLLVLAIDMLTPRKKIATISGVFFGLMVGLLATWAMSYIIELLVAAYEIRAPNLVGAIKVLIGISLCYLGMSVVLQTQDDFRLVIPYVEFAKQLRGPRPLILDTSALIDGRVADLGTTGIFAVPLVIPRFVIGELQQLADSGDKLKRARGRRGLDVISKLQRNPSIDLTIDETSIPGKAVDQMLVEFAKVSSGAILTADSGLNRVASISGITVLNLNDVANALKPSLLPGTRVCIQLIRRGEQAGQAVGYLDDGTMVVAENAEHCIGSETDLEVSSTMQTSAGRLIFARLAGAAGSTGAAAAADNPPLAHQADEASSPGEPAPSPVADSRSLADNPIGASNPEPLDAPTDAAASGDSRGTPLRTVPAPGGTPAARPGPFPPNRPQRSNAPRNPRR